MRKIMTIDDLRRILIASAGEPDRPVSDTEFADTLFEELGYESLALMESAARIEREFGVGVPDDRLIDLRTPGEFIALVNEAASDAA
ncbi:acyl carrier protein [Nocardia ninae]|uniref:Actinorhodin polyketide synthase acyl carrier protein n=2 Tax=Nocardia TaxID=1817 RepID=A0A511M7I0_9NOCA|nr:acyl carrier protein [Nocardia ninae]GEM36068.1 actinorhodin polyketide synthase acyl carrier protein [Nocardia ninae NBRC 108245]